MLSVGNRDCKQGNWDAGRYHGAIEHVGMSSEPAVGGDREGIAARVRLHGRCKLWKEWLGAGFHWQCPLGVLILEDVWRAVHVAALQVVDQR